VVRCVGQPTACLPKATLWACSSSGIAPQAGAAAGEGDRGLTCEILPCQALLLLLGCARTEK